MVFVRQAAKAATLDHFRSSARGQVRQLLQDRLQLRVPVDVRCLLSAGQTGSVIARSP
jgi:hypothetical protein